MEGFGSADDYAASELEILPELNLPAAGPKSASDSRQQIPPSGDPGNWGATQGLNFIYAHLNRVIKEKDLIVIFITGPGHGGAWYCGKRWLEGTYSEV